MDRKITQIVTHGYAIKNGEHETSVNHLVALCNDGSLWKMSSEGEWLQLPVPPKQDLPSKMITADDILDEGIGKCNECGHDGFTANGACVICGYNEGDIK